MAHKNVYEFTKATWNPAWTANPFTAGLAFHIDRLAQAASSIDDVRTKLVEAGELKQSAITKKVRDAAASDAVPTLRKAYHALEGAKATIAARRAQMTTLTIDKADIASALLRQEIRAKMAAMDVPERMALLQSGDARVYDAWRELPIFAPIPAEFAQSIETQRLQEMDGAAVQQLRDAHEAIGVFEPLLKAAVGEVRFAAEFEERDPAFDEFMTKASADVDAQAAKDAVADDSMNYDVLLATHRKRHGLPLDEAA